MISFDASIPRLVGCLQAYTLLFELARPFLNECHLSRIHQIVEWVGKNHF